ncbi:MAG TPA: decarboxylase [Alphaproteobacteria bacterium]|nr:decarboxylase [Alphaproteobacteria bacterium]
MPPESPKASQIDRFFSVSEVRFDGWRDLNAAAQDWAANVRRESVRDRRDKVARALAEVQTLEEFFAYPGTRLMGMLSDRLAADDAAGTARLTQRISSALLSRSYRHDAGEREGGDEPSALLGERGPAALDEVADSKPYFEVLAVTPTAPSRWPAMLQEARKLRRPQDQFVYEMVAVGNFEDAVAGTLLNGNLEAVVIFDGFAYPSQHKAPMLRGLLSAHLPIDPRDAAPQGYGVLLSSVIKRLRPELDVYLLSDRKVEQVAGDASAATIRRVFYEVEEPLEIHLSILDGVADRYATPYFDNLKRYAQRPMGTFHALPVARGKSIFNSNWIRDMGQFYGVNLFLAESSATTGGLDSLLEPTGNIKVAQDKAARAFGADRVFFVTNGTSTSNKMVEQALLQPGDIVIVDRNCHKSHHYGMVLAGAQPLYVEAYPMMKYSMYGGVPLKSLKKALLDLKAEGRLDRARMVVLTNCTFDGHVYNTERVMEECLAIKPDLIFLWDEAWFGFARFSPFFRRRTAMGAAALLQEKFADPAYLKAYEAQRRSLGADLDPKDKRLLTTRLIPDPRKVRLRVYQTNSTHKSMSSLRQGSMVLVKDQDFHKIEEAFHEAVFTHASTSPNLQIIASLDVARRQMELEGYELVMRAVQLALDLRREVKRHPLISKYFQILPLSEMVPAEFRSPGGFDDYGQPGRTLVDVAKMLREDEFALDPTRLTLVCGTAGFDGTQFKGLLAADYDIQVNKTSRNSVLFQTNINNTRSDIANLIKVLVEIARSVDSRLDKGGAPERAAFSARVKALMEDVPDMPNFSRFHDSFREDPKSVTLEGDMRRAFYGAYDEARCEHIKLNSPEIDRRLKSGPELVSANFVIPYPPGFPIMVPGQVITAETITFMRKLDVKEIHGYAANLGLKLLAPSALGAAAAPAARSGSAKGAKAKRGKKGRRR